jgi:hypothetical protein
MPAVRQSGAIEAAEQWAKITRAADVISEILDQSSVC